MRPSRLLPALAALLLAAPAGAQTEGVGYRLTPEAAYVRFEDDAALDGGLLYGGGLGLSFGEFVELGGSYVFGSFETDFTRFSGLEDDPEIQGALAGLDPRDVDVERYGGALRVNLGTGSVVPFLRVGTGLVRFSPDGLDATRNIYLLGGAGLQLTGADRYALSVSVEDLAYRYNPGTTFFSAGELAAAGLSFEDFNQTTVQNLAVRAALQLYLGGRRPGAQTELDRAFRDQFSDGLSGLALTVEPFYGRVDFDEAFAYRDQSLVGAEVGVDLGPLVGLRGFYARGVQDGDPTEFQDVQMVGGDVRLRLSEGGGAVPFLSVGGGYLDVLSGYADDEGAEPENAGAEDRPFAAGGGGVELRLTPRLRAVAEARALLMSTEDEDDVSRPDDVYLSPFVKGGLAIALGGAEPDRVDAVRRETLEAEREAFEAELAAERAAAAAREAELLARLEAQEAVLQEQIEAAQAAGDAEAEVRLQAARDRVRSQAAEVAVRPAPAAPAVVGREVRTAQGDRIVTIPLPEQGELYVRYGDPGGVQIESVYGDVLGDTAAVAAGGVSEAELRDLVRQTLREALADQAEAGAALTEDDVAAIERRVEDRIANQLGNRLRASDGPSDAELARVEERLEDRLAAEVRALRELILLQQQRDGRPGAVVVQPATPVAPVVVPDNEGERVVVAPAQGVVGDPEPIAVVYRPSLSLAPTAGLGFGEGPETAFVGLHADYSTGRSFRYVPEILVGVGARRSFVANADIAFDLPAYGFEAYGVPYVRTGIGLVNYGGSDELPATFDEEPDDGATTLTFNLGVGATLTYGTGRFFVDFSSGNLGDFNRLTAGYRFPLGRRGY